MTESATDNASTEAPTQQPTRPPKRESLLVNLLLNIIVPTIILSKFSGEEQLGIKMGIVVALAFPLIYGARDFIIRRKLNVFSALGFVSILLTGGISLLELDPQYIAIKEAAIPGLIGIATLISLKTRYPLVRTFLYNDKVLKIDRVDTALTRYDNHNAFETTLRNASYLIAGSFFLSSLLNYILAKVILVSPPGTVAFNEELGKMTALSFPVIAVPAMLVMMGAMFYLFRQIKQLTHLGLDEVINDGSDAESPVDSAAEEPEEQPDKP